MTENHPPGDARLLALSTLLGLEKKIRRAEDSIAFAFTAVNETHALFHYRQAVLWRGAEKPRIEAVSGVERPDPNAPYVQWLTSLLASMGREEEIRSLGDGDIPDAFQADWREWTGGCALFIPLKTPAGERLGGLWLTRETPFAKAEADFAAYVADAYGHAWFALTGKPKRTRPAARWLMRILLLGALAAAMTLPVRQSVLAPAEIIPEDPIPIGAPIPGVIKTFAVTPNQAVRKGDPLFQLDATEAANRLQGSQQALATALAELKGARQKAFGSEGQAEATVLAARIEERRLEVAYAMELLKKSVVRAGRDGVALFDDVNDWLGKPVAVGEKILTLADPAKPLVEIRLPAADAINLEPGARTVLFLDAAPLEPRPGQLVEAAYRPRLAADGILAFRLKARLNDADPPRIGLTGTAKIEGEEVSLFYYLFRRPILALIRFMGW